MLDCAPMDTLTYTQEIDLALAKRENARQYVRKRSALRKLVAAGVLSPKQVREYRVRVANLRFNWRACRALLRGE